MGNITTVQHPLIAHSLTVLRNQNTSTDEFRRHAAIVSKILLIQATADFATKKKRIKTPLEPFSGEVLQEEIIVVPVLRSGLAMLRAVEDFLPSIRVGFIGLERDEKTAVAREYYAKIPEILSTHRVMIVDPMLATGGSLDDTIRAVKARGAKKISAVCIVAAPEGVSRIESSHPDVTIVTAAIDVRLDKRKFIVPGLGDFGDRYFGTDC
jgi:uracil phosphoribosyltransferase